MRLPTPAALKPARFCLLAALIMLASAPGKAQPAPQMEKEIFRAAGTGFFINQEGYLLTARHVVAQCVGPISMHSKLMLEGATLVPLTLDGIETNIKADIIATDEPHDLALLKITPALQVQPILTLHPLTQKIHPEDPIAIVGYPKQSWKKTDEFIAFMSGKGKILQESGNWLMLSDASGAHAVATQGYSGGPVLDAAGNVAGLVSLSTCLGNGCAAFKDALARATQAQTHAQAGKLKEEAEQYTNRNVAASTLALHTFLNAQHIAYQDGSPAAAPDAVRLAEMGGAIVNLRCAVDTPVAPSLRLSP